MRIRCYLPPEAWDQAEAHVSGREAHHLIHVLRISPGTVLTCFDGRGKEGEAEILRVSRGELVIRFRQQREVSLPVSRITLGVAVPKHGKLDQIVDQATQLGVSRLIPLETARGVVKISRRDIQKKQSRWAQIAVEAGKQSGIGLLPEINPITPLRQLLSSLDVAWDLVLMATVEGPHEELSSLLSGRKVHSVLLLIGPEGDFTPEEVDQAAQAGAHRISLGETVLRCETAAVVGISLVRFLLT